MSLKHQTLYIFLEGRNGTMLCNWSGDDNIVFFILQLMMALFLQYFPKWKCSETVKEKVLY